MMEKHVKRKLHLFRRFHVLLLVVVTLHDLLQGCTMTYHTGS